MSGSCATEGLIRESAQTIYDAGFEAGQANAMRLCEQIMTLLTTIQPPRKWALELGQRMAEFIKRQEADA